MEPKLLYERFKTTYESLAGKVYYVEGSQAALECIDGILVVANANRVALAGLSDELQTSIVALCVSKGVQCIHPPFVDLDLTQLIDATQVGISTAVWGIAQVGALLEVATNDDVRLVSTLPLTHICLVRLENLRLTLEEIAPELRHIFQENDKNCTVSFMSGPSRTGDIEMKLTLGVHGPKASHVIVLA